MKKTNETRFYEEVDRPGFYSWVKALRNKDGDILAIEVYSKDESHHFDELSEAEQEKVLAWIQANVQPRETPLEGHTSYGMKHVLQHRTNIYVTNNQFKEAMLLCGFYPVCIDELNWRYSISKASPIFQEQEDRRCGLLIPECVMKYPHADWVYNNGAWECGNCGEEGDTGGKWYDPDWQPTLEQCPYCGAIMGDKDAPFPIVKV